MPGSRRPASGKVDSSAMSSNYKGSKRNPDNHSDDISEEESCSLWIMRLPHDCTVHMLLSHIRHCDKVYATVINPPTQTEEMEHDTAAAKVVFWSRQGVDRLMAQFKAGRFIVGRMAPLVQMNRVLVRAQTPGRECRVLLITGHKHIINEQTLRDEVFGTWFTWQDDGAPAVVATFHDGVHRLEWRFGSYRCQAENAMVGIQRKISRGKKILAEAMLAIEKKKEQIQRDMLLIPADFDAAVVLRKGLEHRLERLLQESDALKGSDVFMWAHAHVDYGVDPCASRSVLLESE
ncbi:uncharacterized protein PG986_003811 [Apiospora aurea]|uniref:Uncharacterized protein n=1 Tax=Apiospora aurea TaxID=335848 RepID=A0ABR1QSR3_9PEZI